MSGKEIEEMKNEMRKQIKQKISAYFDSLGENENFMLLKIDDSFYELNLEVLYESKIEVEGVEGVGKVILVENGDLYDLTIQYNTEKPSIYQLRLTKPGLIIITDEVLDTDKVILEKILKKRPEAGRRILQSFIFSRDIFYFIVFFIREKLSMSAGGTCSRVIPRSTELSQLNLETNV